MKNTLAFFFLLALVSVLTGCSGPKGGELIFVEPEKGDEFNFPYFLFIPEDVPHNEERSLVVEPNNTGFVDDDLQLHIEKAERTASLDFYIGNHVARNLDLPLIVPVFPRGKTNWKIYTHALDRDVMVQKGNQLERIDEQLISMFRDARERLDKMGIRTKEKMLLTGFSASGSFANRFTVMHPNIVFAVAAGGLNGLLMLPLDSLENEPLNYPVGINDLKELTGKEFSGDSFRETPQFYFMGALDDNDAIPYSDAYDEPEREQIYRLLGHEMMPGRWNRCKEIYKSSGVNAIIRTYDGIGHGHPEDVKDEITGFFREVMAGKQKVNTRQQEATGH